MKGYLKLTTIETKDIDMSGLRCECELSDVTIIDKMQMMHCVVEALEMPRYEVELFMELYRKGVLKESNDIKHKEPDFVQQARESGAQVIEFDTLDDFIAHIMGGKHR